MAAILRVQAGAEAPTGLPTDRFLNTFHFSMVSDTPDARDTIRVGLDAFYTELAGFLYSGNTVLDYRFYNLADPEPRPVEILPAGWVATDGGARMPWEVACCLSYYAERNIPRRRGRLYIGPLGSTTAVSQVGGVPTPSATLRAAMIDAGQALYAILVGGLGSPSWGVYSPTGGMIHTITDLWVDDAFDTQRRRGNEPTSRIAESIVV